MKPEEQNGENTVDADEAAINAVLDDSEDDEEKEEKPEEVEEEVPIVVPEFLSKITAELSIPKGSIKRVVKIDQSVKQSTTDAVYLIAKAAECFVTELAYLTAEEAKKNSTRKVIQYEDVRNAYETANESGKDWTFLEGILPQKKKRQK